jgi:NAD(P)-dependent dehydrogenase (short-subunit alcohol dehydrogenase family)
MDFQDQAALISGGGSGIGSAVAGRLLADGARVAILGRSREKLERAADQLLARARTAGRAGAVRPLVIQGRHEDEGDAARAVAEVERTFGRLTILFNNAGFYPPNQAVAETPPADWDRAMAVNLRGPYLLSRAAIPLMRRQKRGVIIMNSSTLGLSPIPGAGAYAAAKAGLIMLAKSLALEEGPHGIRALAICPGVVDTPLHSERMGQPGASEFLEQVSKLHVLGRVGTAEEVAALVEFLASDESAWTTGSAVVIDGGISLR